MKTGFTVNETFESIQDSFFTLDGIWRITYANRKAAGVAGRCPEELVGKVLWEAFPELCGSAVESAYRKARETGMVQRTEMQGPDAATWYSVLAVPMAEGLHVYGQDITQRKLDEKALAQNEEREAFLLRLSDALRPLYDPLDVQEASARVLGGHLLADRAYYCDIVVKDGVEYFSTKRVYHTGSSPFMPGTYPVEHSPGLIGECRAGRMVVSCDIASDPRLDGGERATCLSHHMAAVICMPLIKSGRFVACFLVYQSRARVWTQQEIALVRETTERTWAAVERARAVTALRESQAELQAELDGAKLLQSVSTVFLYEENIQSLYDKMVDAAASIMHSQAASLQVYYPQRKSRGELKLLAYKGLNRETADAWEWIDITAGTPCATAWRLGSRVLVEDIEACAFMAASGSAVLFLKAGIRATQATPLYSRGGQLLGMISTHWHTVHQPSEQQLRLLDVLSRQAADVIERRQAESALHEVQEHTQELNRELEEADRNKNEFLSALSHELRNPLAAISVGLQLVDSARDISEAGYAIDIMKRQMSHLCRLVDDLMDITRIKRNKIQLKKERVELCELARLAAEDARQFFEAKGIRLNTRIGGELVHLCADPVRIKQIIGNLLHNAHKFTDAGGETELAVRREEREAVICVRDNGIGIKREMLPLLFEPFTQADNSLDRSSGGLGLGLSIVRSIAQLHGGSASVFSDGLGKGSCFCIRLPLLQEEAKAQEKALPCKGDIPRLKILLIENNRDYAGLLCSMLEKEGHLCACALDGAQGVEEAGSFLPDAVFCDIGLPKMDGFEVARRLRLEPALKDAFLIALTGYTSQRDVQMALEAGFHLHIPKPADMEMIRNALHAVLCKV